MKDTISIITICFNNLQDVKQTCNSVDKQTLLPYEHWIINGSTNDDIKNWLEINPQPPYRKWVSERDNGIADAFNKGIEKSTGSIIYLLNSGDMLFDETILNQVTEVFDNNESITWCHGKLKLLRGDQWVIVGKPFEKNKLYRGMRSVFHPTMFVRKEVYERKGVYDTTVRIAMDYDFLCRIADEKFIFIDYPIATFDPTGVSSSKYSAAMKESFQCYKKYYGFSLKQKIWGWRLLLLNNILKTKFGKWIYKLKVRIGAENL